jgi:transposase InsO family protein
MCRVLQVSRSGYYQWKRRPESGRQKDNQALLEQIKQVYKKGRKNYGSPRITRALKAQGLSCGKNRVARLMRKNGIAAVGSRKFKATTNSRHSYPVAENLLGNGFVAAAPHHVWVSDITYIPTEQGWLYLAAVMDLYSRQIVGWAMDSTMTRKLVRDALQQAYWRYKPAAGAIHHSDRGCQYASHEYQGLLKQYGFIASMSRKGNCYDNACMESFFHTLKTELIYQNKYKTRAQAQQSIFEYIEVFYNRIRLHSTLGYKTPVEFLKQAMVA